jgi:hypothetical protein
MFPQFRKWEELTQEEKDAFANRYGSIGGDVRSKWIITLVVMSII